MDRSTFINDEYGLPGFDESLRNERSANAGTDNYNIIVIDGNMACAPYSDTRTIEP